MAEWKDFDVAFDRFNEFLRLCIKAGGEFSNNDWHGVFSCGTVIRFSDDSKNVNDQTNIDFESFDYPHHRLLNEQDYNNIIHKTRENYQHQIDMHRTSEQYICFSYTALLNDGYPYPGGCGADRFPLPAAKDLALVMFLDRGSTNIFNIYPISSSSDLSQAAADAGEYRRIDYMFPRLKKLVDCKLNVYSIDILDAPSRVQ